jgi:diaminopimelate epimerase
MTGHTCFIAAPITLRAAPSIGRLSDQSSFTSWRSPPAPTARRRRTATRQIAAMGPPTVFRKYHGLGNDFILVDNRGSATPVFAPRDAVAICNRRTGIGGDGLVFLLPPTSPGADAQMRLFNSDGTEPEMCGNGIRCLARFAADLGVKTATEGKIIVDTPAGTIIPQFVPGSSDVRVDMGPPTLASAEVPTTLDTNAANGYTDVMTVAGREWQVTAVSMGNPHAVTFVDEGLYAAVDAELETTGPLFESNAAFPQKTNSEFVCVRSPTEMAMVVWERGAGRTMACGTGACAVVVAAVLTGRAEQNTPVTVHLPGGDLVIEWASGDGHVFMTGPAELLFTGELNLSAFGR